MDYQISKDFYPGLTKITLRNGNLSASFLNFGARMYQLFVPDIRGRQENILLSIDQGADILADQAFFGAVVGPVAGRIKNGRWGQQQLEQNSFPHHIHGGSHGWSSQYWDFKIIEKERSLALVFSLVDQLSDYPGPLNVTVSYELTTDSLIMTTDCQTDSLTIVNPTNHSYFNLSGNGQRDIDSHDLTLRATHVLAVNEDKIPTGDWRDVVNTPYDFRTGQSLRQSLAQLSNGIDDTFVLATPTSQSPQLILSEPISGRLLEVVTTSQSMVLFSTTGFNDHFFVNGQAMHSNFGLAIEPQAFPDIVHHPEWGSIELTPDDHYHSQTIYRFSTFTN